VKDLTRDLDNVSFRRTPSYYQIGRIIPTPVSRCLWYAECTISCSQS